MLGVILCCQNPLAQALKSAAESILKQPLPLALVDYEQDTENADIYRKLSEAVNGFSKHDPSTNQINEAIDSKDQSIEKAIENLEVIVLCDYFGGKATTLALSLTHQELEVLAGVNLSMLLAVGQLLQFLKDHPQNMSLTDKVRWLKLKAEEGLTFSSIYLRQKEKNQQSQQQQTSAQPTIQPEAIIEIKTDHSLELKTEMTSKPDLSPSILRRSI